MDQMGARDFLGRDAELSTFERALGDARAGVPSVLLIDGDAGIGKSSLVAEAARRANVPLMLGRSAHIGGDVIPLAPLTDLLRQVQRFMPEMLADRGESMPLAQWLTPGSGQGAPAVGEVFLPVLELVGRLAGDDAIIIGHRGPALGRHLDVGPLRAARQEPVRRTRRADRHVSCQRDWLPTRRNADGSPSSPGFPPCTGSISKVSAVTRSPPASRP